MKARKAHLQGETSASHQHDISVEQARSLVRQARFGIYTARALLRGAQPTVQHLHSLLRNHELSKHDAAQLYRDTERLAGLTQQLTLLTHAFANTVQNFLLEVTLQQHDKQPRSVPSHPQSSSVDERREETL